MFPVPLLAREGVVVIHLQKLIQLGIYPTLHFMLMLVAMQISLALTVVSQVSPWGQLLLREQLLQLHTTAHQIGVHGQLAPERVGGVVIVHVTGIDQVPSLHIQDVLQDRGMLSSLVSSFNFPLVLPVLVPLAVVVIQLMITIQLLMGHLPFAFPIVGGGDRSLINILHHTLSHIMTREGAVPPRTLRSWFVVCIVVS